MSKGHKKRNNAGNLITWLIAILAAVLVLLVVFAWVLGRNQPSDTQQGNETTQDFSNFGELDMDEKPGQSGGEATEPAGNATVPNDVPLVTQPPVEIIQQAEADYERWLAAAMLISVSMEYPDFDITGIYLASETTLEDKMESGGCYILFTSGGQPMAVHSVPLAGERSEAGTKDISTQTLGFASFDLVDPAAVDTASMVQVNMEELSELIAQSMLVSIYSR